MEDKLFQAILFNQMEVIETLIGIGANVNCTKSISGDGNTPDMLYTPLMDASADNRPKIVKILIAAGANVNFRSNTGATALSLAACNYASEAKAEVNTQDEDGWSPLLEACVCPDVQLRLILINSLIRAGANPNPQIYEGKRCSSVGTGVSAIEVLKAAGIAYT